MKTKTAILILSLLFSFATVAIGATVANSLSPEEVKKNNEKHVQEEPPVKAEEQKVPQMAEEVRLKEEQDRLAAIAAVKRAEQAKKDKEEAARQASIEKEKEIVRQRQARERLCVIKPVMSDAEIAVCKEVWR